MTTDSITEVFADGIVNVSHANGVFRITFAEQESEGVVRPNLKLMIPASQIAPVIKALSGAVTNIGEKIKNQSNVPADSPKKTASE
jgi:hypothetical protein